MAFVKYGLLRTGMIVPQSLTFENTQPIKKIPLPRLSYKKAPHHPAYKNILVSCEAQVITGCGERVLLACSCDDNMLHSTPLQYPLGLTLADCTVVPGTCTVDRPETPYFPSPTTGYLSPCWGEPYNFDKTASALLTNMAVASKTAVPQATALVGDHCCTGYRMQDRGTLITLMTVTTSSFPVYHP